MDEQKLYIMKNSFGLIKIGISKDPLGRANTLRLASGIPVEVIRTIDCPDSYQVEQYLHEQFIDNRQEGEWFTNLNIKKVIKKAYEHKIMSIPIGKPITLGDSDFKLTTINKSDVGNKAVLGWSTRIRFQGEAEGIYTAPTKRELKILLDYRDMEYDEKKFKRVKISTGE